MRHAAARTDEVAVVRRAPGTEELWRYRRAEGEPDTAFAARVRALEPPQWRRPSRDAEALAAETAAKKHVLLALCTGASPRRARPGPCTGCCPARPTAVVWKP
ncbi:hypothetical protein OG762_09800 [Streptomyces sp. NBC_01136]|uniref:hypothetical protein n=1 Tax=unclassified Streptomyces TaxID=2593676 RepID=UPI003243EDAF|nr:hypothetical protein OG762_09800 [Streptomyces sp. NBC_01136]